MSSRLRNYLLAFFSVALVFNGLTAALHSLTHLPDASRSTVAARSHDVPHKHDVSHKHHHDAPHRLDTFRTFATSGHFPKAAENAGEPHTAEEGYLCHICYVLAKVTTLQTHYIYAASVKSSKRIASISSHAVAKSLSAQSINIRGSPLVI